MQLPKPIKTAIYEWCNSINRGIQRTEQCLGQASATEITFELQRILNELDAVNQRNAKIVDAMEKMLRKGPGITANEYIYQTREKKNTTRTNPLLQLGNEMVYAGRQFGETTTYGKCLLMIGRCEEEMGQEELRFVSQVALVYLTPLKRFMDTDLKHALKERRTLHNARLDLDASRRRLKKARLPERQAELEAAVRTNQAQYDRQVELTKLSCEAVQKEKISHIRCLLKFVDTQLDFFTKTVGLLTSLKEELIKTLKGEKEFQLDPEWPTLSFESNLMEARPPTPKREPIPPPSPIIPLTPDLQSTNPSVDQTTPTPAPSEIPALQARVLLPFVGKTASEVSVVKDEIVEVVEGTGHSRRDDGWSLVKKTTGQIGYVPKVNVEIIGATGDSKPIMPYSGPGNRLGSDGGKRASPIPPPIMDGGDDASVNRESLRKSKPSPSAM
ncbi:LOW QUALITY PROTEIN: endophilin-B1-like [Paramacrobiotus metropolitanus]|uniref:LOW QUALITY PROTEIN: endophilin-B1-like n=1 Tax=Paramacrobiotus metropolitanus TaxID=2943436 RepID=UPI002445E71C|nr:LOW QUALITY PROTEIN: endophilin-B1-like [Paramacrobiotus metropolitanus]